ncbi:MAG: nitroreductase family protein [Desulfurococcales archaeon]|nr:nitroreductase family protein [Desulfurococcales archaeon]
MNSVYTKGEDKKRVFMGIVRERRSIRRFKPVKIPEEHIRTLMEAAQRAPSDAALHLWTAIWVRDDARKEEIAGLVGQRHIAEASDFFVFIADIHRPERLLEHRGVRPGDVDYALLLFSAIDAGIAAENMALAAVSMGYGSCFIGGIQNAVRDIIRLLGLPEKTYPLFGLAVGVPGEEPPPRPRFPLDTIFHHERYHEYTDNDLERIYEAMAPITRRGDYLRLLARYLGPGGFFEERNKELPMLLKSLNFNICQP